MMFLDITEGVRDVFVGIASLFFNILKVLADLFFNVSMVQLLNDETVAVIYQRIGLILGLFMLFKLTFSFIQMIIDPDTITDKEKGAAKLIMKVVIVVILLGTVPTIFKAAFKLQDALISPEDNVIAKVVLGNNVQLGSFGEQFAAELFTATFDDENQNSAEDFKNQLITDKNVKYTAGAQYISTVGDAFLTIIIGAIAAWTFLMYTVSIGLRTVQLMFLQLIAPIPIMSYLSSKKETGFSSWVKQCISTYLDLFIRLFILYFAILAIKILMSINTMEMIKSSTGQNYGTFGFRIIYIVLILAILLFAKKAPDLIGELFPGIKTKASGDFGLGYKNRTAIPDLARRGIGTAIGAPIGMLGNTLARGTSKVMDNRNKNRDITDPSKRIKSTKGVGKAALFGGLAGFGSGIRGGFTGKGVYGGFSKDARGRMKTGNKRYISNENNDYTMGERIEDSLANTLGFTSYTQKLKERQSINKATIDTAKKVESLYNDTMKAEAKAKHEAAEYLSLDPTNQARIAGERYAQTQLNLEMLNDSSSTLRQTFKVGEIKHGQEVNFNSELTTELAKVSSLKSDGTFKTTTELDHERESVRQKVKAKYAYTNEQEVSSALVKEIEKVKSENNAAEKEWTKEFGTEASKASSPIANQKLISEIKLVQEQINIHNKTYEGNKEAQIDYDLNPDTIDFTDVDNYIKGKGDYNDDPSNTSPKKGKSLKIQKESRMSENYNIDSEIAARELKQQGNKKSGN